MVCPLLSIGLLPTSIAPPTSIADTPCPIDDEWIMYGDYCYKIYSDDEPSSWWQSRLLCQEQGGDLASIHNYAENYWLLSKVNI